MWRFDSDTVPGYWERVDSPTNVTLRDVTSSVNGPVAVGDKGVAIGRGRERWGIILENGPGAKGRALYAVDTTDDGKRVWFAGAGGALGYYDIVTEERRDYSVPRGNSNGFYSLAVAGERGSEKFLVGDGSGHVLPGHMENNETDWSWSTTPSGGNAVQALCHDADGFGYAVTANGNVFMTTKDNDWERVGVDGAQNSFYDCTFANGVFLTGGGGGVVHEAEELLDHDRDVTWTPTDLGGFAVYGLDAGHGAQLACGEGGNVYVRMAGGDWEQGQYDRSTSFNAGLIEDPMIAVGANGLIVERREEPPAEKSTDDSSSTSDSSGNDEADESDSPDGSDDEPGSEDEASDTEDASDDGGSDGGDGGEDSDAGGDGSDDWERVEWVAPGETSDGDGDNFDGRGELYDGDDNAPEHCDDGSGEQVVEVSTEDDDPADEPDGGSGDSGNDPSDEPDAEDNDPADEPDQPDGLQNDVPGAPGNDQSDPPDEDTDSDADSPDS